MKVNKWQRPTCCTDFGMAHILKNEVLNQQHRNFWLQKLLSFRQDIIIKRVIIHSYRECGTALDAVVELHTDCIFKPIRMGNILL